MWIPCLYYLYNIHTESAAGMTHEYKASWIHTFK